MYKEETRKNSGLDFVWSRSCSVEYVCIHCRKWPHPSWIINEQRMSQAHFYFSPSNFLFLDRPLWRYGTVDLVWAHNVYFQLAEFFFLLGGELFIFVLYFIKVTSNNLFFNLYLVATPVNTHNKWIAIDHNIHVVQTCIHVYMYLVYLSQ